jgi:hypothetical protein
LTSFCLKKLVEIILLQQHKVDVVRRSGRDHFTSGTQSWRYFIWTSWSRPSKLSGLRMVSCHLNNPMSG